VTAEYGVTLFMYS